MREIVFATNNEHKLQELREIVGHKFNILSLVQIGCHDDIPETASTIEGNAEMKARYVKQHYGYDCFSDDTGLEIDALGGEPGVYSARYAGPGHDSEANIDKVLAKLQGVPPERRTARFRTAVALLQGQQWLRQHLCSRRGPGPHLCPNAAAGEKCNEPPRPCRGTPGAIPGQPGINNKIVK